MISFLNAYLLISQDHSVSVCLSHQAGRSDLGLSDKLGTHRKRFLLWYSELVYPVADMSVLDPNHEELHSGKYEPVAQMNAILRSKVARVLASK